MRLAAGEVLAFTGGGGSSLLDLGAYEGHEYLGGLGFRLDMTVEASVGLPPPKMLFLLDLTGHALLVVT